MTTVKIRHAGGIHAHSGDSLPAILTAVFGLGAAIYQPQLGRVQAVPGERIITVPRGADRIVVGSLIGPAVRGTP